MGIHRLKKRRASTTLGDMQRTIDALLLQANADKTVGGKTLTSELDGELSDTALSDIAARKVKRSKRGVAV